MKIDLNCDMGESFGSYTLGQDAAVMPLITSANIACGFHAGDPLVIDATMRIAKDRQVSVGAHPGYPDLQGFGRRNMDMSAVEVEAMILYQVGAVAAFARAAGLEMAHVKPHGALYNQAAANRDLARAIARGVARFDRNLILVGLAGSLLLQAAEEAGLTAAAEAFPDRAYNPDGSLRSRKLPGAVLEDSREVSANAVRLATQGIQVDTGSKVVIWPVHTLCLHGDNPSAPENARMVRAALQAAGVEVVPLRLCLQQ